MTHLIRWPIGALGGAVAAVATTAVLWPRATVGASTPVPSDRPGVARGVPAALDPALAAGARKYVGLLLTDASPADRAALPADSEAIAVDKATAYPGSGTLERLSLVRATKAGTDNPESAALGLRHVNQLAWAVEFTDAKEPLFGPADGGHHTKSATLVLLLDPTDGSFISAAYY